MGKVRIYLSGKILMATPLETSRISELAAEEGIVASLVASPLYRERPGSAFDGATLLDVAETATFIRGI